MKFEGMSFGRRRRLAVLCRFVSFFVVRRSFFVVAVVFRLFSSLSFLPPGPNPEVVVLPLGPKPANRFAAGAEAG